MNFYSLPDMSYGIVRKLIGALGLMGLARKFLGPTVGRVLFRLSPGGSGPIKLNGNSMYLAPSGGYPPLAMANGRYEPATTRLFQKTLTPGMVAVDIGAHVGYYTLLSAQLVGPTGKIYAFEPELGNHIILQKNIELNEYKNIIASRLAVTDRTGTATIYLTSLDSGRHSLFQHSIPKRGSAPIETTTLDFFLEARGWPHIDLIKVDVEGAEVAVLDGMSQLLIRSPKLKLIIEFNPSLLKGAGVIPTRFLDKVWSLGFLIYSVNDADDLLPVTEKNCSTLADCLLSENTSINLLCTKE